MNHRTILRCCALVAIAVSSWFIRLLPIGIVTMILMVPLLASVVAFVAAKLHLWKRAGAGLVTTGLALSLVGGLGCGFVVKSIQRGYTSGPLHPELEEDLAAFRASRAHRAERLPK